jgi:hypothetical protein
MATRAVLKVKQDIGRLSILLSPTEALAKNLSIIYSLWAPAGLSVYRSCLSLLTPLTYDVRTYPLSLPFTPHQGVRRG